MRLTKRSIAALSSILMLAFLLVACGRGRGEPTAFSSVPPPPIPTATTEPSQPSPAPTESPTATPSPPPSPTAPTPETDVSQSGLLTGPAAAAMEDFLIAQVYTPGDPPPRRVPGAVLLVDTPAGRFLEAAGVADLASGEPVTVDDRFEIGSITKLFTAVALLQLQEEGALSLDDPLAKWLPDLAAEIPYGDEMTLRQLATHTAGLGDYERDLYPMPQALTNPSILGKAYAPTELVRWVAENKPPLFPPGASGRWMYSNTGYVILGMVLEAVTGQPLGEIYRERIFELLGMESAILLEDAPAVGETVRGYNAMTGEYVDATGWNPSGAWASGALAMNAPDLARFAQALAGGELFQDPQSLAQMTDFVSTGQPRGFTGYGLGLAQLAGGTWGHAGGTPGFGAVLLIRPDEGVTAVWLGNSGSFNVNPEELSALVDGWIGE